MSSILSLFTPTRHASIDPLQAFRKASKEAEGTGRVSFSNLKELLNAVKNSPQKLSLDGYREIQDHTSKLDTLLANQHSNKFKQKSKEITDIFSLAQEKLTPQAIEERIDGAKDSYTKKIKWAVKEIEKYIPSLEKDVIKAENKCNDSVADLPTKELQEAAKSIIKRQNYSAFNKDSAITLNLFPSHTEQVMRRNGNRLQKIDHPHKHLWTLLKKECKDLEKANALLEKADSYTNNSNNSTFTKPTSTGKVELSEHQKALLEFANELDKKFTRLS